MGQKMSSSRRPTPAELETARAKRVPDIIAPGLKVLFCGINPGLYSAAVGHHFARPGNRFWPTLHAAGFSERLLSPSDERELLDWGYGITNLVDRPSATADELTTKELIEGARALEKKVRRQKPACVAFVGVTAYRTAFGRRDARIGAQEEKLAEAKIWVLPN